MYICFLILRNKPTIFLPEKLQHLSDSATQACRRFPRSCSSRGPFLSKGISGDKKTTYGGCPPSFIFYPSSVNLFLLFCYSLIHSLKFHMNQQFASDIYSDKKKIRIQLYEGSLFYDFLIVHLC